MLATSGEAVTLRVQTSAGDSVFLAPVGDTVAVVVSANSEGQALSGLEVFLRYDPRLFQLVNVEGVGALLGRVLVDTAVVLSDSNAVVHVAEADLVGKAVSGIVFTALFQVIGGQSGFSEIGILERDPLRVSAYTEASRAGVTVVFESIHVLQLGDLPPVLLLPARFGMFEDETLVVDLHSLAQDAESAVDALIWQIAGQDTFVSVITTDTMTVVLQPQPDFFGTVVLTFSVADPSGGVAERTVPLRIEPVNDPPEMVQGSLPDSVILAGGNTRIDLSDAAFDIDGDELLWSGEAEGGVNVAIEEEVFARVFAPLDWVGEAVVVLRVSDASGESAWHSVRVVRTQKLNNLPGDFDGNGEVGFSDFLSFTQAFGQSSPSLEADLNGDGKVDFSDFLVLVQNFGRKAE